MLTMPVLIGMNGLAGLCEIEGGNGGAVGAASHWGLPC
jgi:hypothetical protein